MSKYAARMMVSFGAIGLCATGCQGSKPMETPWTTSMVQPLLRRAGSCRELEQALRDDARIKMNLRIDAQIEAVHTYGTSEGGAGVGGGVTLETKSEAPASAGAARASASPTSMLGGNAASSDSVASPSAPGSFGDDKSSSAGSYSETNVQVKGVDEADIVKTDGRMIYLIHGGKFLVLNAWPSTALGQASATSIEGSPVEMYVANNKAVIYSVVDGTPVYAAAGITPRANYNDGYGIGAPGIAVGRAPVADVAVRGGGAYFGHPLTKITVLTIDGAQTSVAREIYYEGSYLSSRRVANRVRTVLNGTAHGPELKYSTEVLIESGSPAINQLVAAMEKLRAENIATIDRTTVADWLPVVIERQATGVRSSQIACEDFYVPPGGSTEYGVTEIASLDLDAPEQPLRAAAIIGAADTVYASATSLYLAARAWVDPRISLTGRATTKAGDADVSGPITLNYTHLHKFDLALDPAVPTYVASGSVRGSIHNQFSLDERDNVLRISTTENRLAQSVGSIGPFGGVSISTAPSTVNNLFTLTTQGNLLAVAGKVEGLAPGEQIYSTRFVGRYGYVVTFRRVDPLFVFDLIDPANPRLRGELKIPGFSDYMHPLDDTHLLTIGRDADSNGRVRGLALQVFDVTDPAVPRQAHKFTYSGDQYGRSEANYNHKAFTYFADRSLLAFPYVAYDPNGGLRSSLELFRVNVAEGIRQLGSVDHTSLFGTNSRGYCGGYFSPEVRRGVFLDNVVYSISYGGVIATDVNDLTKSLGVLPLAAPTNPAYPICMK